MQEVPLALGQGPARGRLRHVDCRRERVALSECRPRIVEPQVCCGETLQSKDGAHHQGESDGDPCQSAAAQGLQCYRSANLSVPLLRQLARPGILTLQNGNEPPVYALLVGLTDQTATLRLGTALHKVRLVTLGRIWRGDFATYWRAPAGYGGNLRDGSSGPMVDQLVSQLAKVDGLPAPAAGASAPIVDAALRERIRAFQRSQGLKPDGQPGPLTFMQIDSATATNEPRLQTEPR